MLRRIALILAIALLAPLAAESQQARRTPRVGMLYVGTPHGVNRCDEAFRAGLAELGYVEGKSVFLEVRAGEGKSDRLGELAAELVRLKVDVIFAPGTVVAQSVKQAKGAPPVVFASAADPIGSGLIEGFGRPGGNLTGLSLIAGPEIGGKYLELLREAAPRVSRVAVIWNPDNPALVPLAKEMEVAARSLGVELHVVAVRKADEFDGAFTAMVQRRVGAFVLLPDPVSLSHRVEIAELALKHRLPAMYGLREHVEAGGLMAYGVDLRHNCRRAATFVDKILKGAKPATRPVEQPTKFELVINLKTAKALGLTIPESLRLRTDDVIQ
ncbi:MAG: ABC transporter substrate-binding protein [Candidatus Rokubacteria bacterium]|nr:ABC transporter substrate-binding protein [Candidatus Rokubacteria bacterium]